MQEVQTTINVFASDELNRVGAEIIENCKGARAHIKEAYKHWSKALIRRWVNGKLVHQNYEAFMDECGSQRELSERLGITEAMVSNDLRAYRALLEEGCETEEDVVEHLRQKNIPLKTSAWEKLPRLLNEPESSRQKDQRPKDEERLEKLLDEAEEILNRNQGGLKKKAEETKKHIESIEQEVHRLDPYSYDWKSRKYLDWVKSLGVDFLTLTPSENIDPHHTDPSGGTGGVQQKLPDVFTIPVDRITHNKIGSGEYRPHVEELQGALIRTMALFIMNNFE